MVNFRQPGLILAGIAAMVLMQSGCISSRARYARPDARPKITKESYIVPRNWDYRYYYKIPAERLMKVVESYRGTPYRYGGNSRRGMDCSGFVQAVFRDVSHARFPRTTRGMNRLGKPVQRNKARTGDLVFFRGGIFNAVNHVGIYIENGRFAHASSSRGVIYSNLSESYYQKRFAGIRRVF